MANSDQKSASALVRIFRAMESRGCRSSAGSRCDSRLVLNPPPKQPDPWIYDTAIGQLQQFRGWQSNPGATPPTYWIPDAAWQLADPGWSTPIPFWLPQCGINLYSTYDPNVLPNAPSSVIQVTIGNDSGTSAGNTSVRLGMSYLGIGRANTPIAPPQTVSIGPNSQVTIPFPTPTNFLEDSDGTPQQWLGVYIDLENPHDSNLANNQAISMWMAMSTDEPILPVFPIVNEFSASDESISLVVIPLVAGVTTLVDGAVVNGPLGPYPVAPGQSVFPSFELTVPPEVDGGTFLAPLATVAGFTASGMFVGGLTIVAAVND